MREVSLDTDNLTNLSQVLKLKERLSEAEKEIAKLSAAGSERCSGSPISTTSIEPHKLLHGDSGGTASTEAATATATAPEEEDLVLYMHDDYRNYVEMMDWVVLTEM